MDISNRMGIRRTFITRCFRIEAKYQAWVGKREERGPRGLDFAKTRGWKAAPRADCSRREENNANNGRDVALRWAQAYAANTITLWTRLPFKWKQTWNAKIQQRVCPRNARNRASTPLPPLSIIGMQIVHEHCIQNVPYLPKNISRTDSLMNAKSRFFFNDNIILLDYFKFRIQITLFFLNKNLSRHKYLN